MARDTSKINTPSAETIAREQHVLELRRAGASFDKIAQEVNLHSRSDAHKIYKRALARTLMEPAAEIRRLEADRLDRLQLAVWTKALRGDLPAVDRVLRVMERRARLLGLDHADGIAERALALEADKVRLVALAFGKALDSVELTDEQREQMTRVLLEELRAGEDGTGGGGSA
jgi:hypothetical protein